MTVIGHTHRLRTPTRQILREVALITKAPIRLETGWGLSSLWALCGYTAGVVAEDFEVEGGALVAGSDEE